MFRCCAPTRLACPDVPGCSDVATLGWCHAQCPPRLLKDHLKESKTFLGEKPVDVNLCLNIFNLNYRVMHPVERVSIKYWNNLRT
jgi:hypothetical protein